MINNKQDDHALLSASGSHRWIGCPASVAMEYGIEDETSEYAAEGIEAHELASSQLTWLEYRYNNKGIDVRPTDLCSDSEMVKYVTEYIEYLYSIKQEGAFLYWEQKVDFSNAVINGYGTADSIVFDNITNHLDILDFKYGFTKIEAKDNMQMILYAIGVVNSLKINHDYLPVIKTITLHIVQPRINNFDTWTIKIEELQDWIKYFQVVSIRALTLTDEFNPSPTNCKYCKAESFCPALNKFVEERFIDLKTKMDNKTLFTNSLTIKQELDNEFIKKVLDNSSLIKDYIVLIERIAKERLVAGESISGYKAVQTMSCRKLNKDAEDELYNNYGEKIYQKKLLGIGELERVVGKKELDYYTHKEVGNIAVVKDTDKRLSINEMLKFEDLTIKGEQT